MGQDMRHTLERELKLEAQNGFVLPELPGRRLEPEILVSTYYDTSDFRLAAAGITLRRRVQNRGPAWQLKLPHGDARSEIEVDASDHVPPSNLVRLVIAYTRGRDLLPAATLRTNRSGVRVRGIEGDVADVVIDVVSVIDDDRVTSSFTEIEVELVDDNETALEQVRRVLLAAGAVDGDPRPKLLQALDLQPAPAHPRPRRHASTSAHVRARIAIQRRALIAHDPGTRLGTDPEELHQMRVAVRRLRALLRAIRPLLRGDWATPLGDDLRWLGRALGPVRDADVLLERFQRRADALSPGLQSPFTMSLGPLVDTRESARGKLVPALEDPRYFLLLEKLDRAIVDARLDDDGPTLAELARKEFRRLNKRVRRLDTHPSDEELHEVRILGKRARYAAEFAAPTMARDATPFIRRAKRLQDVLGEHQDSCIAEVQVWQLAAAVRDTDAAFAAGVVVERERSDRRQAREDFPKAWRALKRAANDLWE